MNFSFGLPLATLIGSHSVTEAEFNALVYLKKKLHEQANRYSANPYSFSELDFSSFAHDVYQGLFSKSANQVPGTELTFVETRELVNRLLKPKEEPKFGMLESLKAADESVKSIMTSNLQMPVFPSVINFLNGTEAIINLVSSIESKPEVKIAKISTHPKLPTDAKSDVKLNNIHPKPEGKTANFRVIKKVHREAVAAVVVVAVEEEKDEKVKKNRPKRHYKPKGAAAAADIQQVQ